VPLRKGISIFSGLYRVPVAHYRARAVLTNTCDHSLSQRRAAGSDVYDGASVRSRAVKTGIDRIEIRRRNLIAPDELPLPHRVRRHLRQRHLRSVDGQGPRALRLAGLCQAPAESKKRGRLRGIGLANYVELTMGYPREWSKVTVDPDGGVEVAVGTLSSGRAMRRASRNA